MPLRVFNTLEALHCSGSDQRFNTGYRTWTSVPLRQVTDDKLHPGLHSCDPISTVTVDLSCSLVWHQPHHDWAFRHRSDSWRRASHLAETKHITYRLSRIVRRRFLWHLDCGVCSSDESSRAAHDLGPALASVTRAWAADAGTTLTTAATDAYTALRRSGSARRVPRGGCLTQWAVATNCSFLEA